MSTHASTDVSNTDLTLFRTLANAEIVDVDVASVPTRLPVKPASRRASVGRAKAGGELSSDIAPPAIEPPRPPSEKKAAASSQKQQRASPVDDREAAKTATEPERRDSAASHKRKRATSNTSRRDQSDDESLQKQGVLIELQQLENRGAKLSRAFTMRDSLAEMEFELSRQNSAISASKAVAFMREALQLGISAIEIGNTKLGPFLSIDGWANSVCQDMRVYDHSLERIYKRYFRKQQLSPVMELGMLLVGSMITWHFKSQFLGQTPAAPQSMPKRPTCTTARAPPFRDGTQQTAERRSPRSSSTGRPTMRPPTMMFA